jgi:peptidoglycan hydrolase-like protein with peptidoglycan-binding domain
VAADGEIGGAHPTLRRGSSGSAVRDLQLLLRTRGFDPGSIDGAFGARTDAAVRSFQRARGLAADGIVGSNTWSALPAGPGPRPPAPGTSPAPRPAPGTDPAIDALGLSEPARSAAYSIKARHPWVVFTSGRRDPARQAWAMAGNVVRNRQWIAQTYASNPVSRAAQAWVDAHPEARTQQAVAEGLTSVFAGFSARDLGRLSYHLSGLAFDIQPVPAQAGAVTATVRSLPGVKEFLTREGGLTIWHVAF